MRLSEKQKRFCNEYLIDLNATQAAIRAGYSKKTACSIGHENLYKPDIQKYIQERQKALQQKTEITQERILKEFASIAFSDIRKFYENGVLKSINDIDDEAAAALASVRVFEERDKRGNLLGISKELKTYDKIKALENLGRHLGMFKDKLEIINSLTDSQIDELFDKILNASKNERPIP